MPGSEPEISRAAKEAMKSGYNCCQAVLIAASQLGGAAIDQKVIDAASFLGQGMNSGCTCGALTGMIMASGLLIQDYPHPLGKELPKQLHDQFKEIFGSTCCRAIKKRRSLFENFGNRACIELTGTAAMILYRAWKGIISDATPGVGNYTDL